jgi:uncharacterized membrane protein (DUF485 family)
MATPAFPNYSDRFPHPARDTDFASPSQGHQGASPSGEYQSLRNDDSDFRELRQAHRSFGVKKMLLGVGSFLLYVLLSCFTPGLMDLPVFGHITVGLVLGLLQFVVMAVVARLYAVHRRTQIEPLVGRLREGVEWARQPGEQELILNKSRYGSSRYGS